MAFRDFLSVQANGMAAMANAGVIGLHMVSGPAVGFAIGYGLDWWLGCGPWLKLVFFFIGIVAGFLNVYRDTRLLMQKLDAERHLGPVFRADGKSHAGPRKAGASQRGGLTDWAGSADSADSSDPPNQAGQPDMASPAASKNPVKNPEDAG